MNIHEFTGKKEHIDGFDTVYDETIEKLGGIKSIRQFIPFSDDVLKESYKQDVHFNTKLTPLFQWDMASGITTPLGQSTRPATATGYGLFAFAARQGLNEMSQSQAVCILKQAARKFCETV